jgi:hypothetical protein
MNISSTVTNHNISLGHSLLHQTVSDTCKCRITVLHGMPYAGSQPNKPGPTLLVTFIRTNSQYLMAPASLHKHFISPTQWAVPHTIGYKSTNLSQPTSCLRQQKHMSTVKAGPYQLKGNTLPGTNLCKPVHRLHNVCPKEAHISVRCNTHNHSQLSSSHGLCLHNTMHNPAGKAQLSIESFAKALMHLRVTSHLCRFSCCAAAVTGRGCAQFKSQSSHSCGRE